MKWINKGHEFDKQAEEYLNVFADKKMFIFGAGDLSARYANVFLHFDFLHGFVDNDTNKQGLTYFGKPVISLERWIKDYKNNTFLVVCVNDENFKSIRLQLLDYGLEENVDFLWYEKFYGNIMPILLIYKKNMLFLPLVQISLTERCTLKCKKCAHGCNYVPHNALDLSLESALKSSDCIFSCVDYVRDFVLIGGEPFLYKELARVIEYIGDNYRNNIDIFSITTNGTIVPSDEILELCRRYNVLLRISNYTQSLPRLHKTYETIINKLNKWKVRFYLGPEDGIWMDYGFEYYNRNGSPTELCDVFDKCNTPCHEIRGNKFHFCVMARSISENMGLNIGTEDYIDLDNIDVLNNKMLIFEYFNGFSEKGYLDMCNYCHGAQSKDYVIPVAEQM